MMIGESIIDVFQSRSSINLPICLKANMSICRLINEFSPRIIPDQRIFHPLWSSRRHV